MTTRVSRLLLAQIDISWNLTVAYVVPYLVAYLALPFIIALPVAIVVCRAREGLIGTKTSATLIVRLTFRWGFQTIGLNIVGWMLVVIVANAAARGTILFRSHETVETAYALTALSFFIAVSITVCKRSFWQRS